MRNFCHKPHPFAFARPGNNRIGSLRLPDKPFSSPAAPAGWDSPRLRHSAEKVPASIEPVGGHWRYAAQVDGEENGAKGEPVVDEKNGYLRFDFGGGEPLGHAEVVLFTTKGNALYAFVMGWPDYRVVIRPLALKTALRVCKISNVELLGYDG